MRVGPSGPPTRSRPVAFGPRDVSICIPTYERGPVLLATLEQLVGQAGEVLVVDQTPRHEPGVAARLEAWRAAGDLRWIRLERPAIPTAMNEALRQATRPLVLFLDDDIEPQPGLVAAHAAAYRDESAWAVAGQVLQPGEQPGPAPACRTTGFWADLDFRFCSTGRTYVQSCIACNFSVCRDRALALGGFDERFEGVAYRFETEFCRRLCRAGGRVLFEPEASIRHLRAPRGGTRSGGGHLTSASPAHGVGDYYFALREPGGLAKWWYILRRPWREVATRFHLRHPWWIPVKLLGEARAAARGVRLARQGPRLLTTTGAP